MVLPILAVITIGALILGIGLSLVREVRTWGFYLVMATLLFVGGFVMFVALFSGDWPAVKR